MNKLKLTIEELEVASFDTETKARERGTVAAQGFSGSPVPLAPRFPRATGPAARPDHPRGARHLNQ